MKISGGCHCGALAYEATIDPEKVLICHCTDCQKMSGTAFRTVVPVPADGFAITRGTPKIYVKVAESGNKRAMAFCAECGTNVYASADEDKPGIYNIRVGTADQREHLVPRRQIWHRSALPWLPELDGTTVLEKT